MTSHRLTTFPTLTSTDSSVGSSGQVQSVEVYSDLTVSRDNVIHAWALLLQAYTLQSDLVFYIDGRPSLVSPDAISSLSKSDLDQHTSGIATSVVFGTDTHSDAKHSLTLSHSEGTGTIRSTSSLPRETLLQIAAQLRQILKTVAEPCGLMNDNAAPQLSILNADAKAENAFQTLHQVLDHLRDSDATAISHLAADGTTTEMSYRILHQRSDALAHALVIDARFRALQASTAPVIPVMMSQGPELYLTLLAVLKAGAAFCPLHLDSPVDRIKFVLKDTASNLLLATRETARLLPEELSNAIFDISDAPAETRDPFKGSKSANERLCYVMYTSGSTGQPKGVTLSHSAVVQSLKAHDRFIPSFSRFLQFAAPTFDVSMFEIFFTLLRGSTIVSCDRATLLNDLPHVIRKMRVDGVELTPTVAGSLLQTRQNAPGLKLLLTIGEMLTANVVKEFGDSSEHPGILYAMYGPTEAAIHCTLQPKMSAESKVGNIGHPLDTVSTYVISLDSTSLTILPVGQIGELALGGHQLADEYLNRPDQTSKTFVVHPKYGRLYRTGDKARQLPNGTLECLGRVATGQVKLRGQRIELGEVEAAALRTAGVTNAMASVLEDQLVLFCLKSDDHADVTSIETTCEAWLPGFMVPNAIRVVSEWPQLPSGKVDRKRLEAEHSAFLSAGDPGQAAPASKSERMVQSEVAKVLGRKLGTTSALARSGLDSLKAIRLASGLREKGFALGATDIFTAGTIQGICGIEVEQQSPLTEHRNWFDKTAQRLKTAALASSQLQQHKSHVEDIFPCSPLQNSMLAETALNPQAYWNRITLDLGVDTFESARRLLSDLARHNNILRSGFQSTEDVQAPYVQIVWKELVPWQIVHDNQPLPDEQRDLFHPFRVRAEPLGGKWRLNLELHHAQYDGWSWDLLLTDISALLQSQSLPARLQFKEVSCASHAFTKSQSAQISKDFWANALSGFEPVSFPNLSKGPNPQLDSQVLDHASSVSLQRLSQRAQVAQVHPQSIVLSALSLLLKVYLGSNDICIGNAVSGRTVSVPGIESAVGPCIATVPLRTQLSKYDTVEQLLQATHENGRLLLSHSQLPLADVKRAAGIAPGQPIFDVLVVWQATLQDLSTLDEKVRQVSSRDFLENRLLLELEPHDDTLSFRATYMRDWIPEEHMRSLLRQLDDMVDQVINTSSLQQAPLWKALSVTQDLSIYNPTPEQFTSPERLSYHVEEWAHRDPDRIALSFATKLDADTFESTEVTYGSLNGKANQIAQRLLRENVTVDSLILVAADKGLELYASILGVVKAGAAFIGIAPDTPSERISLILDQIPSPVVLVSKGLKQTLLPRVTLGMIEIEEVLATEQAAANPELSFNADALAFSIFTSGTTGVPKGVLVTQRNLASFLNAISQTLPKPRSDAKMLQACSQTFDMFVYEVFWSWQQGMCICTAPKDVLYRDVELTIRAFNASHLDMTPTVASLVRPDNVPSVDVLMTAGEAMNQTVWKNWAGRGLFQGYGPSETTIVNAAYATTKESRPTYLGKVFDNSSAFVIDADDTDFKILPRGAIGEYCFGGDQVFRGYHKQDSLNRSKLINHPTYGKLYRSGDIGRMLDDGSLLITGRLDDQVKIRGQRVELGEINSIMLEVDGVESCATFVFEDEKSGKQELVAFWVAQKHQAHNLRVLAIDEQITTIIQQITDHVQARLPVYMCPDVLVPVSCLPQTSQSKIDKRLLRATYDQLDAPSRAKLLAGNQEDEGKAWTQLECAVAGALSKSTGLAASEISRTTSFFNYGIDSISAISLGKALRDCAPGSQVEVSTIMKAMTVARLAQAMEMASNDKPDLAASPPFQSSDLFGDETCARLKKTYGHKVQILPCTPLQEALLLSDASETASGYYNKTIFSLRQDSADMKRAWQSMVERHEILRTCFASTDSRDHPFAQIVLEAAPLKWHDVEVDKMASEHLSEELSKDCSKALDSDRPPFSITMFHSRRDSKKALGISMHHAMYDGVALSTLYKEVEQCISHQELASPSLLEPFLKHIMSQDVDAADRFWGLQLDGLIPNAFPNLTGKSLQARQSLKGASITQHTFDLPLNEVIAACRGQGTSLLASCQAAWAKVLSMYLGESDVCFGNVTSGRTLPVSGIESLVAPCFNTLPVRASVAQGTTNRELIGKLQQANADFLPHQMTPLRRLQAKFGGGQRLFDTLFILQQGPTDLDQTIWSLEADFGEMGFPVVLEITPDARDDALRVSLHCQRSNVLEITPDARDDALRVSLHCQRSNVLEDDAGFIFQALNSALLSCVRNIEADVLSDMTLGLSERFLSISNLDAAALPTDDMLLFSAFERCVHCKPEATALDFLEDDGQRTIWSFSRLDQEAGKIAGTLQQRQVCPDEPVPICLAKSPAYYACILGVLKSGAAFTPFDPAIPAERKAFMLNELGARLVLSGDGIDTSWTNANVVNVTSLQPPSHPIASVATSDSLAYRLYTSGSTGRPKAVSVEHRHALQTIEASKSLIRWNEGSRLLQFASTTFDMCYYDCFVAWSYGFALCAASQLTMFNDLPGVIKTLGVNMLDLTPSVASSLKKEAVPSVDYLYCIGEAMPQVLVNTWAGSCVNSYGPTEAAMCVTIFPVDESAKSSIIGKPFNNTSFHILNRGSLEAVPVFGIGELYLGGAQIAREYHANKQLTETAFVNWNGKRLYKTGDLVRKLASGDYEFLGRADDQVKIRGLRVELGEISSAIRKYNDFVKDVSTQVFSTKGSDREQIVAFVVLDGSPDKNEPAVKKQITTQLTRQLPSYMVPTAVLILDQLPLSPAGKVDRRALARLFQSSEEAVATTHGNKHEPELSGAAAAVREVLAALASVPVERIVASTTIFQLGFDSISAVQIASMLKKRGLVTTAGKIVGSPTVEGIAASTDDQRVSQSGNTADEAQPRFDFNAFDKAHRNTSCQKLRIPVLSVAKIRPCSPLQSGMLTQFLNSDGKEYFNQATFRLPEDLDQGRLSDAFDFVVEKHDMLRTGFASTDDRNFPMVMITHRARRVTIPLEFRSSCSQESDWHEQVASRVMQGLHEPAWAALVQANSEIATLSISMHHALFDATSMSMIIGDLQLAYSQTVPDLTTARIEPTLERMLQVSPAIESEAKSFWEDTGKRALINQFPDLTPLLVTDKGFAVAESASTESFSALQQACRENNVTVQAAGQAAWARVLAAYTGESIVTFGSVFSGRMDEEAESIAFPCIATMPVVAETSNDGSNLMQSLMRHSATVHEYQHLPLTKVQRWMGLGEVGFFDTLFAYQKQDSDSLSEPWELIDEQATAEFPVSIELSPDSLDKLQYRITYRKDRIPSEQAHLILKQVDNALCELLIPSKKIDRLDDTLYSISPAQHEMLQSEATLLHEFVELGAQTHPQKIAFEFFPTIGQANDDKKSWTYAQLDQEGNRVANFIRNRGARQGTIVAVCFDKCPEASFAMLGILKAGCGFLALDPGAPAARKKFITEDSGASSVLTMTSLAGSFADVSHCPVLALDAEPVSEASSDKPLLDRPILGSDTSYCLYTSGTTGTPKGCDLSHENAVQALMAFQNLFKWTSEARWLQFASFHFDVSVLEQYWSWSVGVTLVSAPRDVILEDLPGAIRDLGITHIDLTPSLARLIDPEDVPSLCDKTSVFITGGEALKQEIVGKWGSFETIYNGYGPTEATIGCTMFPRVPANGKPSNIGPQFLNVGSFVLKPGTDVPVLRGAQGELCVSGPLVAKGYLNRPDLTRERFPTIEVNGSKARIYRTGDLVRILHDGTFAFLGRADDQVKLRGQRLEIGEINAVEKESHEHVQEVSTLVLKHPKQQREQLVSFIATEDPQISRRATPEIMLNGQNPAVAAARESCQSKLPGYMVPTHFIQMNRLPLSANNKVDAKQLKALYEALDTDALQMLSAPSEASDDQWTDQDRKIAQVLANHLGIDVDKISKVSSIFELGLDSISNIGFTRALKSAGFSGATTSLVMKNSTIGRLGKVLGQETSGKSAQDDGNVRAAKQSIAAFEHRYKSSSAKALKTKQSDIEYVAPCTPLQQGIISRALESDRPIYFAQFRFRLAPNTDLSRLRKACDDVVDKVSILRTSFIATDDGHAQVVTKGKPLTWSEVRVDSESQAMQRLDADQHDWWSMNREQIAEPLRITVMKTESETYMALDIFHALYDGSSLPLLIDAVLSQYHGENSVETGPVFRDILPYGPLCAAEGVDDFWMQHLKAASPSAFEKMRPLIGEPAAEDSLTTGTFTDADGLEKCRRALNTTHQALVQACWATVLQEAFDGPVNLGMVVSGRSIDFPDAHLTIGPLFNTIPFYLGCDKGTTWKEAVERCHNFNTAALPFQHTPLRDIKRWCRRLPQYHSQELFENLFVFQKAAPAGSSGGQEQILHPIDDNFEADYPLAFEAEQTEDGSLNLTIVAQAYMSDSKISEELIAKFVRALSALVADPNASIGQTLDVKAGVATPETNGPTNRTHGNGQKQPQDFQWDKHSLRIREEVASLADVSPEDVDPDTSILELGLDSIDAIKLSSRLKRATGLQIPVSRIMQTLTISRLAGATVKQDQNGQHKTEHSSVNLQEEEKVMREYFIEQGKDLSQVEKILPLAPLQEGMLAQMLASEWSEYFNHDVLRLHKEVDVQRLQAAWQSVVDKNQILRTSFFEIEDQQLGHSFAQVVHKSSPVSWGRKEGSEDGIDEILTSIRTEARNAPSDTVPFRLTWLHAPGNDRPSHMIISIAHALYDGWALGLIHEDVNSAYAETLQTRPNVEPILGDILTTARDAAAQDYWRDTLTGLQPALLQSTEPSEKAELFRHERQSALNSAEVSKFCRSHGITLNALCQAAFSLFLSTLTKKLDVAFGVVLSGRDSDEASDVMFPTMNTVAFRSVVHGSRRDMVKYVQQNMNAMKPYEKFPLRKAIALVQESQETSLAGGLFDSVFIFQRKPEADSVATEEPLYESVGGASDTEYPLAMEVEQVGEHIIWRNACKSNVFSSKDSEDLLQRVDDLVSRIIAEPDAPAVAFETNQVSVCGLEPFTEANVPGEETTEPSDVSSEASPLEGPIRKVLAGVAHVEESGLSNTTTMFNLGLDSISAIKVSSLLRKQNIKLTVSEMLKAGTVAKMARVAQSRSENSAGDEALDTVTAIRQALQGTAVDDLNAKLGISKDDVESVAPATAGQTYMLSMHQNFSLFFPTFTYEIKGYVSFNRLRHAWAKLVDEQPLLRTELVATGNASVPFIQIVRKPRNEHLDNIDDDEGLSGPLEPSTRFVQLRVRDERPFGIRLALHIHHALYDGVSLTMLTDRLAELASSVDTVQAVPPHSSFTEYIATSLTDAAIKDRRAFWSRYLAKIPAPAQAQSQSSTRRVELYSPGLIRAAPLQSSARRLNITLQPLLLAIYAQLYAKATKLANDADIAIGIYLANRASSTSQIHGLEHLAAPTVNLVPLRVRQPLTAGLPEIAKQIAADLREVQEGARAQVGLWELDVTVGTWVNFLSLPGEDAEAAKEDKKGLRIELEKRANRGEEGYARVVDANKQSTTERERSDAVKELSKANAVRDSYAPSVDLEIAVRNGMVDVGLFCPENVLGLEDAKGIIDELKKALEGLGEQV